MPPAELTAAARERRRARYGTRVTYSPKVFIPLTMLCRDTLRLLHVRPSLRPDSSIPYLDRSSEVLSIARRGCARWGVTRRSSPWVRGRKMRYPVAAREWLAAHGYASDDRLPRGCDVPTRCWSETGLLPARERRARSVQRRARAACARSARQPGNDAGIARRPAPRARRSASRCAPDKVRKPAARRRSTGRRSSCSIPFTTGILVGFGETPSRNGSTRCCAIRASAMRASRSRPGSHRAELPAQAGHEACSDSPAVSTPKEYLSVRLPLARLVLRRRRCTCRHRRT